MIYVSYAQIPDTSNISCLYAEVKSFFSNPQNVDYLDAIILRNNEESKKESLCALIVLSMLIEKTDVDVSSLSFFRSNNGKPYFKDSNLHFSLTHSKGYAAAALSDASPVGLDLECTLVSHDMAHKLAARWFNEKEESEFSQGIESFARIWTKKESYAKMKDIPLSEFVSKEKITRKPSFEDAEYMYFDVNNCPLTLCKTSEYEDVIFFETKF